MKVKLLFLLFFATLLSFSQNPTDVEHNFGTEPGFSGPVQKMVVQQDGKIIVLAFAQFYKQTQIKTLIRINADGSLDPTFDYNPVTIFKINSIALQPDGKIIVGGYDGILIRINTDGSRDTSFNSTLNFEKDSYINCIAVQPDGKILVTNKSDSQLVVPLKYLTRLNADGSIDSTFIIGTGFFNNPINSLAVQSDGKILVVSEFSFFQVNAQKNLIRLNADGTKDTSFDIGTGFNGYIYSMILQNDGKIIVGGNFSSYQGIAQLYLIRLNTDGSKDTSFINPSNFKYFKDIGPYDASDICLQTDGKIIVNFHKSNEWSATDDDLIYRFNSDGSIDTSFAKVNFNRGKRPLTPYYYDADVHTIAVLNNGKIIIGGEFSFCQKVIENNIVFLNADGSKDSSFYKETGFDNWVRSTAIQTDGKTLVAGDFDNFKGVTQPELIRLNTNESIDTSFKLDGVFKGGISSILLQADGKILAMGPFENYVNIGRNYLVRLNPDGSLDTSFKKIFEFEYFVEAMALQPDGKILLSAFVDNWPNLPYKKLFRLNTDGSEDISFDAGNRNDFSKGVYSIVVQNDGKIIVGGVFTTFKGIAQKYLIRLNPDGSKDTSFDIGTIFDFSIGVRKITLQPDGKILVNGVFSPTTGDYQSFLIRLNSDGSKDVSFNQGTGLDNVRTGYGIGIRSVVLQNDGKILVGGEFDTYQGIAQNRLTRLNIDGSIDTSFDIGTGFAAPVESVSIFPDGKIIAGGAFSTYRRVNSSPYLIRLKGTSVQPTINATTIQTNLTCPDSSTGSASIVSVFNGKSPYSYLWSNGATTATINGLAAGNYSCTITDADSSTVTKSFIIIIDSDFQKPTIIAPATLTVNANGNCTAAGVVLGTPVTTDNCTISSVTNNAPSAFPIGNTTVTWTVKDASNNTATATQIITVKDVTKPTIFPPAKITVNTTSNCTATGIVLGTPVTADNCSVVSVTNNAPTTFQLGNTTVTWTVKDASNNTATATQIVTVKDITLPTITPPLDKTVNITTSNCTVTGVVLGTPITADNCSVASVTNNALTTFQLGNTTVTWTVKDASNNIATATQIITVKETVLPTITAPPTVIVNADLNGTATGILLGTPITADNCAVASVTNNAPTTFQLGNTTVTWTVKDASNNTATATQIVTVTNSAPTTLIPDLNFEKKLIALGIDSSTTDGKVLTSSISSVTFLDVSNSQIADLTGIQDFVGLTTLYCNNNQLASLDVSMNTALKNLYCHSNQLTSLDVSKNVSLKTLYCGSNQLTNLDVSQNVSLITLNCNSNQSNTLDVSKNVALTTLSCNLNQLTSLDVSQNISLTALNCNSNRLINLNLKNGKNTILSNNSSTFKNNPNLYCILVDDVAFSNANWTALKDSTASYATSCTVQQYTLIPDINFEKKLIALGIDSGTTDGKILTSKINLLTTLDVSNSLIANLTGIQDFVGLTNLNCYNNQLTNIDVTKNIALTNLNCGLNQLASLDISKNTALTYLTCTNMPKLTTLDVSKNVALLDLYCYNNLLTALDISQNVLLLTLQCSGNQISVLDVSKNVALKTLTCNSNQLTSLDVTKNTSLTGLNCKSNQLINLDLRNGNNTILSNLKSSNFTNNPNLTCIQVDNVTYSNANWSALKDATASYNTSCAVQQYTLIPDVNFEKKLIALGIDSGVADGKVLTSKINTLTSLVVSNSQIADLTGIQDFVALTYLACGNNQLTSLDVTKNTTLTYLSCSFNSLKKLDISNNTALKNLYCGINQLMDLNVSNNTALKELYCDRNQLTSLDVSKNIVLSILECFANQLTNLDVSKNTDLTDLQCTSNQLISLDVSKNTALTGLQCESNKLTSLDVSKNISLVFFSCSDNALTSLNLKNGNNINFRLSINDSFTNNPNLTCIQVDDVAYSDVNWALLKDATASYSSYCSSYYTLIPDVNFEKRLIALGIDSGTADGKVLTSSISSLTSLDVSWRSISDLTGIQDFVALTSLDCSYNYGLNALDLSKNITLTSLKSNGNSKLLTFDVSKNLGLKDLECSNANLTTLDVSKNTSLSTLRCNNNQLTTLDLTNNKTLSILSFYSNQLSTIDVSNNVALDTLNCNSNKLIGLDVSKNINLKRLSCSNNYLESLNLKNGNNINFQKSYINYRYNPNLTCIQVDNKTYSDANWSDFKDATASYSENCPLPSIVVSSEFEDKLIALGIDKDGKNGSVLLASITNVTSIDVSNSGITNLSGIEYFAALETLICKGNVLTTINLSSNTVLKYLDCSNNPLATLDVSKNILLTELYCNGIAIKLNKINNTKTSVATQLTVLDLSNNLFLTKLNCSNNQLVSLDVSKNTILTDIDCSNNSLQNLNVSNGNNTNMLNVNFKSNSSLSCIKVDDAVYSNTNWTGAKDATAIYSKTACALGIEDVVSDRISIYPNPVKGQLYIDNIVLEKVTVYDALGKLIKTIKFTNASVSNTVDLNGLTKGVYFIYLQSQGTNSTRKIIIE